MKLRIVIGLLLCCLTYVSFCQQLQEEIEEIQGYISLCSIYANDKSTSYEGVSTADCQLAFIEDVYETSDNITTKAKYTFDLASLRTGMLELTTLTNDWTGSEYYRLTIVPDNSLLIIKEVLDEDGNIVKREEVLQYFLYADDVETIQQIKNGLLSVIQGCRL